MRKVFLLIVLLLAVFGAWNLLTMYSPWHITPVVVPSGPVKVESEESVTINVVKKVSSSVVTVIATAEVSPQQSFNFGPFGMMMGPDQNTTPQTQSIGSGFIVSTDGFIITNKHVVSDVSSTYQIVTDNNKKYNVQKIYRDPLNDVAILKVDPSENMGNTLQPVTLGNSSNLQVGSYVIAIGTALGEFRSTVTTGVISGLGRGITAGDQYAGYAETLDNVIQTSAAINPGNSGGPLVNSSGQVIGVNTAVDQSGQNIGFALPINVVKDSLDNFNQTGQFNRPYVGIGYKQISQDVALLNDVPEGAYVQTVVSGSPADKAGVQTGDIVTKIDNIRLTNGVDIATIIQKKKVGDSVSLELWRDSKTITLNITLTAAPSQ